MTRVRNIPDRLVQRQSLALTQLPLYRTRGLLACTQKTRGSSSEWEEYFVLFIRYFSFVKFLVPSVIDPWHSWPRDKLYGVRLVNAKIYLVLNTQDDIHDQSISFTLCHHGLLDHHIYRRPLVPPPTNTRSHHGSYPSRKLWWSSVR